MGLTLPADALVAWQPLIKNVEFFTLTVKKVH